MHASNTSASHNMDVDIPPDLALVPSVEDDLVMCGATFVASSTNDSRVPMLHKKADEVLNAWLKHDE
ncbi:hypothetical protein GN958_ATG18585 [Phytophthora infestans]|uniref:Uncharacterized protein n=1 Tax=Phytophthora infestans TaxID=4787 RepID=A0A8S9TZY8_PHYIN|nr:hypothetical protein GN958_ATG18585 [Phytophthora infestans]